MATCLQLANKHTDPRSTTWSRMVRNGEYQDSVDKISKETIECLEIFDEEMRRSSSYSGSPMRKKMKTPPSHYSAAESSSDEEEEAIEDRSNMTYSASKKSTPGGNIFDIQTPKQEKGKTTPSQHAKTPDKILQAQLIPKLDTKPSEKERDEIICFANEFLHHPSNKGNYITRDLFMPILMKHMVDQNKEEFSGWHNNMLKEDHAWIKGATSAVTAAFERHFKRQQAKEKAEAME